MGAAVHTPGEQPLLSPLRIGVDSSLVGAIVVGMVLLVGALDPVGLLFPASEGTTEVVAADFGDQLPDRYSYDGHDSHLMARTFPDVASRVS